MQHILLQERLRGAIWGQFVGDASFHGTQFIDPLKNNAHHFTTPSQNLSNFTHYGDAALLLLHSLVQQQGFSARDFGANFVETFASPDYFNPTSRTTHETIENYHLSLEEGHPDMGYEFQGGADTADIDTATRLAPLVALYWDDVKLFSVVDRATRVTQNNELVVAYMRSYTRILRNLFQGEELRQVFVNEIEPATNDTPLDLHVRKNIKHALTLESQIISEATKQLGKNSHLDQSYPAAIQAALKYCQNFTNAILENIQAGGDSAGRAALIGTWLGAYLGLAAIPEKWRRHLDHYATIKDETEQLLRLKAFSGQ